MAAPAFEITFVGNDNRQVIRALSSMSEQQLVAGRIVIWTTASHERWFLVFKWCEPISDRESRLGEMRSHAADYGLRAASCARTRIEHDWVIGRSSAMARRRAPNGRWLSQPGISLRQEGAACALATTARRQRASPRSRVRHDRRHRPRRRTPVTSSVCSADPAVRRSSAARTRPPADRDGCRGSEP
jgi:hypothetical protein